MAQTVAEQLAEILAVAGVRRTYGIIGDSLNGLTDAILVSGQLPLALGGKISPVHADKLGPHSPTEPASGAARFCDQPDRSGPVGGRRSGQDHAGCAARRTFMSKRASTLCRW
jgi:hypothetical protein